MVYKCFLGNDIRGDNLFLIFIVILNFFLRKGIGINFRIRSLGDKKFI